MSTPEEPKTDPSPDGDWRNATRFRQAERIDGATQPGGSSDPNAPEPLLPLLIAGGAMIAATAVLRALTGSGILSFGLGLIVGLVVLIALRARQNRAERVRRQVAEARGVDREAVAAALEKAEAELATIDAEAAKLPRATTEKLGGMTDAARRVLDVIAADPLDLDRARKFVVAYLPSARRAVEKYVGLGVRDAGLEARFHALIDEMTETCRRQEETLRSDDRFDLEVEMDTLADRLKTEQ